MKKRYKILTVIIMVVTLVCLLATQCLAYTIPFAGDYVYVPDEFYKDRIIYNGIPDFSGYNDFYVDSEGTNMGSMWYSHNVPSGSDYDYVRNIEINGTYIDNYENFLYNLEHFCSTIDGCSNGKLHPTDFTNQPGPAFIFSLPISSPYSYKFEFHISGYGLDFPDLNFIVNSTAVSLGLPEGFDFIDRLGGISFDKDIFGLTSCHTDLGKLLDVHVELIVSTTGVSTLKLTDLNGNSYIKEFDFYTGDSIVNFSVQLGGYAEIWSYIGIDNVRALFPDGNYGSDYFDPDALRSLGRSAPLMKISSLKFEDPSIFESYMTDLLGEFEGLASGYAELESECESLREQYEALDLQCYYLTQQVDLLNADINRLVEERDRCVSLLDEIDEYIRTTYAGSPYAYSEAIETMQRLQQDIDDANAEIRRNVFQIRELQLEINDCEQKMADLEGEKIKLEAELFERDNADALDEIFTGTSQGLLEILRGVADLGYTTSGGVNVTIGGLLTVAVLGACVIFILRLVMGGGGK